MNLEIDVIAIIILCSTICISIGIYKNKFDQHDRRFEEIDTKFEKMEDDMTETEKKFVEQYDKMWSKVDKLTDAVYEVKNYIQLIATCFKMDIKNNNDDEN